MNKDEPKIILVVIFSINLTIPRNAFFPNPRKLAPAKLKEFTVKHFEFFSPFFTGNNQ
jgi:hypothetical protein